MSDNMLTPDDIENVNDMFSQAKDIADNFDFYKTTGTILNTTINMAIDNMKLSNNKYFFSFFKVNQDFNNIVVNIVMKLPNKNNFNIIAGNTSEILDVLETLDSTEAKFIEKSIIHIVGKGDEDFEDDE